MEEFNGTSRRPKALPCAHHLCTPCLENCIARRMNKCSVCRKTFAASTVDDIPINTDLEKIIEYVTQFNMKGTGPNAGILTKAQLNIDSIDSTIFSLEKIVSDKTDSITRKEAKRQNLLKEIDEDNKS
ncbi:unnamed protein product [Meganyctiphanes norvegica]|uniref:Zinc finger C3HC4 RING-type domain-containing protein n=1 Tax=Meganyctiphanes norvegica TaxID=48144 RepID=A0AAV2RCF6_MEGNR